MRLMMILRVLAYCCLAVPAAAQSTFANMRIEGLPVLYVTDRAGHEIKGRLVTLTDSAIVLQTGTSTGISTRTFTPAEVSLVERRGDSLKNGAIIGAVVGTVSGAASAAEACAGRSSCVGPIIGLTALSAAVWAAAGAGIDAAIPGRTRIWPGKSEKAGGPIVAISSRRAAFVGWGFGTRD